MCHIIERKSSMCDLENLQDQCGEMFLFSKLFMTLVLKRRAIIQRWNLVPQSLTTKQEYYRLGAHLNFYQILQDCNEKMNFGCLTHLVAHILHLACVPEPNCSKIYLCIWKTENKKSVWNKCPWQLAISWVTQNSYTWVIKNIQTRRQNTFQS